MTKRLCTAILFLLRYSNRFKLCSQIRQMTSVGNSAQRKCSPVNETMGSLPKFKNMPF